MHSFAGYSRVPLQAAAAATGNGTAIEITSASNGAFTHLVAQVQGTFSATVTFEGTVDGTNYVAVGMTSMADNSTVATTATTAGLFKLDCGGLLKFRARVSAYTSGAINVTAIAAGGYT